MTDGSRLRLSRRAAEALRPGAPPVSVVGLTKDFRGRRAVDGLTFSVAPARITGFLGPKGGGKSTTPRMLLGLANLTSGDAFELMIERSLEPFDVDVLGAPQRADTRSAGE